MAVEKLDNLGKKKTIFYFVSVTHELFEIQNFYEKILLEKTIKSILLIEKNHRTENLEISDGLFDRVIWLKQINYSKNIFRTFLNINYNKRIINEQSKDKGYLTSINNNTLTFYHLKKYLKNTKSIIINSTMIEFKYIDYLSTLYHSIFSLLFTGSVVYCKLYRKDNKALKLLFQLSTIDFYLNVRKNGFKFFKHVENEFGVKHPLSFNKSKRRKSKKSIFLINTTEPSFLNQKAKLDLIIQQKIKNKEKIYIKDHPSAVIELKNYFKDQNINVLDNKIDFLTILKTHNFFKVYGTISTALLFSKCMGIDVEILDFLNDNYYKSYSDEFLQNDLVFKRSPFDVLENIIESK